MAERTKQFSWNDDRDALLAAWEARARELGIDMTYAQPHGRRAHSGSLAIEAALRRAIDVPAALLIQEAGSGLHRIVRERGHVDARPTNPLRAMREAAGLSQVEAARRMGRARRTVQLQEARASVSPEMVERASKAFGKAKNHP